MSDWQTACQIEEIPLAGARVVKSAHGPIAVFRTEENQVFAVLDRCPHKGGPLSMGKLRGNLVECPLHEWLISLEDGNAVDSDGEGCVRTFPIKIEGKTVLVDHE